MEATIPKRPPPTIKPRTPDGRSPSKEILDEIVRRVVETVAPERIILFGSAARGTMHEHSDIDLLIVKKGGNRQQETKINRSLYLSDKPRINASVDLFVHPPEDVERDKDFPYMIFEPALREGRVLYEA